MEGQKSHVWLWGLGLQTFGLSFSGGLWQEDSEEPPDCISFHQQGCRNAVRHIENGKLASMEKTHQLLRKTFDCFSHESKEC